jgi:4-amino-4-deoxy-L-arabinose transferase-like glycosyltransferase
LPGLKYTVEARSEVLFTFLLAAFILTLLKGLQAGKVTWFAAAGVLLGLVDHTKPVMSFFPVIVLALLIWHYYPHKRAVMVKFGWFCAAFALILLPWVVRNYLLFQKFIPGTTLLGYVIYHDFQDHLAQRHLLQDDNGQGLASFTLNLKSTAKKDYRQGKSEVELDQLWQNMSLELIKRYPLEFGLWSLNNVARFWFNLGRAKWDHPGTTGPSLLGLINGATLVMAVLGYGFLVRLQGKRSFVIPILVVYYTAVHAVTSAEIRYSIPLAPYLLILVTLAFLELRRRWLQKQQPGPRLATS